MAALPDRFVGESQTESLIDLRDLTVEHLSGLLEEETESWRAELDWDFRASADLVRRFVQLRSLNGFGLAVDGVIAGYSYYVAEDGKGLVGDFYVRAAYRTLDRHARLLQAVLDAIWRTPGTRRVEAQLMMLSANGPQKARGGDFEPPEISQWNRAVPYARWFHAYPRQFLEAPLASIRGLPARETGVAFGPWSESWYDAAAQLIASAYRGHTDSSINDQYRSAQGARRFLTNIVQYPGCGAFFAPASLVGWDRKNRALCGLSLASLVAPEVGHITQICVGPQRQGQGIGYELLRRSLIALAAHGCRDVSLTVTSANESALRLYRQVGFRLRREFSAYVWEMA
ncbi:MAG TPA: GNAT family N-acetyltransferase [Bryobacteraceae bacterium]|nr:GNAT family N-acetyltransferase [Bryobacteraceae bacterium]